MEALVGGNTFYQPRLARPFYLRVEALVRPALSALFAEAWRIPAYHADKADFGDLDVMVASSAITPERLLAFQEAVGAVEYVRHNVGHSFLTPVPDEDGQFLQVDLFSTPDRLLDTRATFMSWGDFGNILSRTLKPLGLRWGQEGLEYVHRLPEDDKWKKLLLVSTDVTVALHAAGLDPAPYLAGFPNERAMFDYLRGAARFNAYAFLNPESSLKHKSKKRPGMHRFVAYLREVGTETGTYRPRWTAAQTDALLPGYGILAFHEQQQANYAEILRIRHAYNGELVMELTGRQGKVLGALMKRLKDDVPEIVRLTEAGDRQAAHDLIVRRHQELSLETAGIHLPTASSP